MTEENARDGVDCDRNPSVVGIKKIQAQARRYGRHMLVLFWRGSNR